MRTILYSLFLFGSREFRITKIFQCFKFSKLESFLSFRDFDASRNPSSLEIIPRETCASGLGRAENADGRYPGNRTLRNSHKRPLRCDVVSVCTGWFYYKENNAAIVANGTSRLRKKNFQTSFRKTLRLLLLLRSS